MVIVNLLSRSPKSTASDFCKIGLEEEEEEEASIGLEAEEVVEEAAKWGEWHLVMSIDDSIKG